LNETKFRYLLIKANEDGEPCTFLDKDELLYLLKDPIESYGIRKFLKEIPEEKNVQYWEEDQALLLEFKIIKVKPVTTSWEIEK
jgi:hypothetical protein